MSFYVARAFREAQGLTRCLLEADGLVIEVAQHPVKGFQLLYLGPQPGWREQPDEPETPLPASPDLNPGPSLLAMRGAGYAGVGVLDAMRLPDLAPAQLRPERIEQVSAHEAVLYAVDDGLGLRLEVRLTVTEGILSVHSMLRNVGDVSISVARCCALLLPLPAWAQEVIFAHGSWAREGHTVRRALDAGGLVRAARLGRTGFAGPPNLTFCNVETDEENGSALNVQLCWSGSHELRVTPLPDGMAELAAEPVFLPGEISLAPGETFGLPEALVTVTDEGLNGVQDKLHDLARARSRPVERPVHFNTWEARYFDFDEASLLELARSAKDLGAERFVLDDGWFLGRRDDTTSLGDWIPDPERFPRGLDPFIADVRALGLGFGLWVEPEMVSQKSKLFADRPEWVIGYPGRDLPTGRHQLVLDLSLEPVQDHLFAALSQLLTGGGIDYLKWDCNRELYPMHNDGRICHSSQTQGVYSLLSRLGAAFPNVEIESCASGGGRIDFGILPYVTRFWASDATDALDRIRIQDAFLRNLPIELMGAHIGPSPNHITGRRFSMRFRVLVALFGHFGLELDPAKLTEQEAQDLACGIAIYKRFRDWMKTARYRRFQTGPDLDISAMISLDGSQALVRVLRVDTSASLRNEPCGDLWLVSSERLPGQ